MIIFCGPGSEVVGAEIGRIVGVPISFIRSKTFADGETRLNLTCDVGGEDVTLIHSTHPPQDKHLVQLLLLLDAIRYEGASSIRVMTPYLAYARQDRRQLPGEVVSIVSLIRLLEFLGVDELVTVNVHNPEVFRGARFTLVDLSAVPLLAAHLKDLGCGGALSLSLGKKHVDLVHAMEAASVLGGGYGRLKTFRDPSTGEVRLEEAELDVAGMRVAVFDDVITSGGTHLQVAEFLRDEGASEVHLACVHSLLSNERRGKVIGAVDSFICSDTVPGPDSKVKVAPLLASVLSEVGS